MSLLTRTIPLLAISAVCALLSGCAAVPSRYVQPVFHNPFPQLHRVAILPFYNQSHEPTVDGEAMAMAYYNELQSIQGFEVMPVGVARRMLEASRLRPASGSDFQELARLMRVDAVIVGSVTEYSPYYPPRLGLSVDWYAANPGYHPIPAGYGLPWGTAEEEFIPSKLVKESEFALAREQLKTQTPHYDEPENRAQQAKNDGFSPPVDKQASYESAADRVVGGRVVGGRVVGGRVVGGNASGGNQGNVIGTGIGGSVVADKGKDPPPGWPDPRGFVPLAPGEQPPPLRPQYEPIITHTRIFHGQDAEFTQRLEAYYETRDDARFGGWQTYLQRPSDFIRFCCYLHVTETLAARGGAGESQVVWRWPISR